jgi:hypothetical protein
MEPQMNADGPDGLMKPLAAARNAKTTMGAKSAKGRQGAPGLKWISCGGEGGLPVRSVCNWQVHGRAAHATSIDNASEMLALRNSLLIATDGH